MVRVLARAPSGARQTNLSKLSRRIAQLRADLPPEAVACRAGAGSGPALERLDEVDERLLAGVTRFELPRVALDEGDGAPAHLGDDAGGERGRAAGEHEQVLTRLGLERARHDQDQRLGVVVGLAVGQRGARLAVGGRRERAGEIIEERPARIFGAQGPGVRRDRVDRAAQLFGSDARRRRDVLGLPEGPKSSQGLVAAVAFATIRWSAYA